jgi:hypothetical protein
MNGRIRNVLVLLVGALVFASCAKSGKPAKPEKPAAFSHRIHHVDNDISCKDCHPDAWTEEEAGLPELEICQGCHMDLEDGSDASRLLLKLVALEKAGRPIWGPEREHEMEFNHAGHAPTVAHMNKLGQEVFLKCGHCHRDVEHSDAVPAKITPEKKICLECHE